MEQDGFLILRGVMSSKEIETAKSFLDGQTMDYTKMKRFIEDIMLQKINTRLGFDIQYTKFRVSNNNNSVDAGAFHRDIHPIKTHVKNIPVYTCLCYLDSTVMELIPGSHLTPIFSYSKAFTEYYKAIRIFLNSNDLLCFNSSILHRGIFTENLPNRRLIQVFNCFPSKDDLRLYRSLVLDIKGSPAIQFLSVLFKNSYTAFFPNLLGYLNSATGTGASDTIEESFSFDLFKYSFFSTEGGCQRLDTIIPGTKQTLNLYYINIPNDTLPDENKSEFLFYRYNRQFILYGLFLITLLTIVCFLLYKCLLCIDRNYVSQKGKYYYKKLNLLFAR